jgi:hypothetical protein
VTAGSSAGTTDAVAAAMARGGARSRALVCFARYGTEMRIIVILAVAACASPAPSGPLAPSRGPAGEPARRFRQLIAGALPGNASRTTFVLAIAGDQATLTETEERASHVPSIAEADRAQWVSRSTRTYRGTRRADGAGLDLELASADMQPLNLHCVTATLEVAAAGAHRVRSPNRGADPECGDRGVWDPPATSRVEALVCGAAGQSADDADDDDRLVFAPGPGVEWAVQNEHCALEGGGLRIIR